MKNFKKKLRIEFILGFLSILYFFIVSFPDNPTYNRMFIDSGAYAYIGQQINNGKILYKNVFDMKFPAIYYIYSFLFKVFPDTRWTLYFADIFTNIIMLVLIFLILKKFKTVEYFWIVSFLFTTTYRIYPAFSGGNLTEHYFLFFSLISLYLLFEKPTKIGDFILGNCFMWLLMLKQPYALIVLVIFFFFKDRILKGEKKFFIYGFLTSFLFFVYVFIKGLPESIETITFPFYLTSRTNFSIEMSYADKVVDFINKLIYIFGIFFYLGPGQQILMLLVPVIFAKDRLKLLFFSLLAVLFLIYFLTFGLYSHYMLLLNIPLIIGLLILIKNYPKKLVILFLIVSTFMPFGLIKRRFIHFDIAYYRLIFLKDRKIKVHPLVFTISKYVKEGDKIFMIPDYCELYFFTKTESPWRFLGLGQAGYQYQKYKNELKKLIREKPPDYFYLEIPVETFENIFELKKEEYELIRLEDNFYKFRILKYNSS